MQLHPPVRNLSLFAAGALATGTLLAVSPAAQAAVPVTDASLSTYTGAYNTAGSCSVSGTNPSTDIPFTANGKYASNSASSSHTATSGSDATDVTQTTAKVSGKARATVSGGSLKSVDFSVSGSAAVNPDLGTAQTCNTYTYAGLYADLDFVLAQDGFLTIDISSRGYSYIEGYIEQADPDEDGYGDDESYGFDSDGTTTYYLPAGTYEFFAEGEASARAKTGQGAVARKGSGSVHASFRAAGAASDKAKGSGKKYLTLPASRECDNNKLKLSWKGKAKKVDSAKVLVNGKKKASDKHPKKGKTVVLKHLRSDRSANVTAVLNLKKGGTKTVSRSYGACTL